MNQDYLRCTGWILFAGLTLLSAVDLEAQEKPAKHKAEYVSFVTQGGGLVPWQQQDETEAERDFRRQIEARKLQWLNERTPIKHPVLLTPTEIDRARKNIQTTPWAAEWYEGLKTIADYVIAQPPTYVHDMIPELTPTNPYGFTCPNCVGVKSQEAVGISLMEWDYHDPDRCSCGQCGHVYPSEKYPETAKLVCPRSGEVFNYYLNKEEREHPEDRSGKYAYRWVGRPIHVSFTGVIRERKVLFMAGAAKSLAVTYQFTGNVRYAERAKAILLRLAVCYRQWLYHDYWDTIADCDPMYAAWHDHNLPLEWKRHLCSDAYKNDKAHQAAMLRNYWGAGRIHPSTDSIGHAAILALAYDLTVEARNKEGKPVWDDKEKGLVERDLLLEYVMGAEPFIGGANQATNANNKAPRVYRALAAVAKCLSLPQMADTALRGYEIVRDRSFLYDGFSKESPSYTNMYLSQMVIVPEELNGFRWPADFESRRGTVDLYNTDDRLRLMFRAMIDQLRPDGRYTPLSDTTATAAPGVPLIEIGCRRYSEYFQGKMNTLYHGRKPTEYAMFHLDNEQITGKAPLDSPELCFPAWMTAFLRHGTGPDAAMLSLTFSPPGNHRHDDNLALFYTQGGQILLGDHGYVGDMPVNKWIHSTLSHNLVVVDHTGQHGRTPRLHRMLTSSYASVVEASSQVYKQCSDYRRTVVLLKGLDEQTFAVDIFRVKGSKQRHAYRLFSEIASSDAANGRLDFVGLNMPAEKPLPEIGASLAKEDIFGLRDVRIAENPPSAWQAVWKQSDHAFRTWILSQADRVEASNGPGQETRDQAGRRVRYLDVVREGSDLESTFVAVHDPAGANGSFAVIQAERLPVPDNVGEDAVAVRIESTWGSYLVLSEFEQEGEVANVRFAGALGIICHPKNAKMWMLTSGARTCAIEGFGFEQATPIWAGELTRHTANELFTNTPKPENWQTPPADVTPYVLIEINNRMTGFPVAAVREKSIAVNRFPLTAASRFELEQVRFLSKEQSSR